MLPKVKCDFPNAMATLKQEREYHNLVIRNGNIYERD